MTQHEHLALVLRASGERPPERLRAVEADLLVTLVGRADLLERDLAPGAQMVERGVARHAQDPGRSGTSRGS